MELDFAREIIGLVGTGSGLIVLVVLWRLGFFSKGNGDHKLYDFRIDSNTRNLEKLTETANHNFSRMTERFDEHAQKDAVEFERINSKLDILIKKNEN
jgi:hypothetical protein